MIKVMVFDFDGTLVDSNPVKTRCFHHTVAGIAGGEEALAVALAEGGDRHRIFARVAELAAPGRARELVHLYGFCCSRGIYAAPERRGGRAALDRLDRMGLSLWINTATPGHAMPELLRARGLMGYFDGVLGSSGSKAGNLRHVMRVTGASPREIIMVGDGPDDRVGAQAVGCWFVAVTQERRISGRGRFAMRDLTGLPALVTALNGRKGEMLR